MQYCQPAISWVTPHLNPLISLRAERGANWTVNAYDFNGFRRLFHALRAYQTPIISLILNIYFRSGSLPRTAWVASGLAEWTLDPIVIVSAGHGLWGASPIRKAMDIVAISLAVHRRIFGSF